MDPIASAKTRIKQLCCMELPSETVVPALLKEIRAVVPGCGSTFFWCGEDHQVSNLYDDPLAAPEVIGLYLQEFYGRPERELHPGFVHAFQHYQRAIEFDRILSVDRHTYLNSDFYNLVLRPPGYADGLHLFVRAGGRPLGDLAVWRDLGDAQFTAREKQYLQGLEPYIAHALGASGTKADLQDSLVDEDKEGALIIVDRTGKIQHLSSEARKLLFLAINPQVTARTTQHKAVRLPAEIIRMCRNLVAVFEGNQGMFSPPAYQLRNPWGGFVFRAYWLDNGNPLDSLIGITIKHQIPLPMKVLGQMARFPLSRQQMQICLLLAIGYSDADVARHMTLSVNTVLTHNRRIYDKLKVHSRAELIDKLLEK